MVGETQQLGTKNIYQEMKSDPENIQKRKERKENIQQGVDRVLKGISARPTRWSESKVTQMDYICLKNGKRCIMWDDEGEGFYLLMNWDWIENKPREEKGDENLWEPGWYSNLSTILRPPLLGTVPPDELAQWIDQNTIHIHHKLLPHLQDIYRNDESGFQFSLPDANPYWQQLILREKY